MARYKIAVVVGSNRRESINRRLAQALGKLGRDLFDVTFARIDDLPLYNQDDEGNLPASVVRFKAEIAAADGVLFVTPEHSRSIPAVLKNADPANVLPPVRGTMFTFAELTSASPRPPDSVTCSSTALVVS